ncbi:hypothetical protein J6590_102551, partial [Homalodisca vitripennis]
RSTFTADVSTSLHPMLTSSLPRHYRELKSRDFQVSHHLYGQRETLLNWLALFLSSETNRLSKSSLCFLQPQ